MRYLLVPALLASFITPVLAQTLPGAGTPSARSAEKETVKKCVHEHLAGLKEQLKPQLVEHMQQFKQQNPNATREAKREERKSFMRKLREEHKPEIKAAVQQCKAH